MTPREKAKEMVWGYYHRIEHTISDEYAKVDWEISKQCALIGVGEILNAIDWHEFETPNKEIDYWEEVKQEIEKL